MKRRLSGQTGSEYMLVISAVVVAVVGSSFVFVPQFRDGTKVLGSNVRHVLSTGSFAGLGLANATVHDAPTGSGFDEGGNDNGNNGTSQQVAQVLSSIPFMDGMAESVKANIQKSQLQDQVDKGGKPPTGIDGNVCGIWALSYIMNAMGADGGAMSTLMDLAKSQGGILISDDFRIDRFGMKLLADAAGLTYDYTQGKDFPESKSWLDAEIASGKQPAVLVTKDGQPHWMVVTGTITDDQGRITGYKFQDSTTDAEQTMSSADFQKSWAQQGNEGLSFGKGNPAVATK
jgi:hypothetical protein